MLEPPKSVVVPSFPVGSMRSNTEPTATPKSSVAVLSKGVSEEPALSVLVKSKSPEDPMQLLKLKMKILLVQHL